MAGAPLLELGGISKSFGGVAALAGVDFTLRAGEVHGLVGENGAGKSTLMKIIAGVHTDFVGEMRLDGRPVRFRSTRDARDAGIWMVHQELSIAPHLSVAENVFLGVQPVTGLGVVDWRRMQREARDLLARLGIDADPAAPAGSIPLGLQQLIEIGRVLFSGARIVILDEPTSALSPPEIERLFGVLQRLRGEGTSFVFISHFIEDILRISDRVTVFRNGERVLTTDASATDKGALIHAMIGRGHEQLEGSYQGAVTLMPESAAPLVLETEGLTRAGAFEDVSLSVHAGEVVGIYGFMGCGQLKLARALFGKVPFDRGTIRVDGKAVWPRSTARATSAGLAFVPESRRSMLFREEPVYKNISIASLGRISPLLLRPAAERAASAELVARLNVRPPRTETLVGKLSGGNQQKVALARWLVDKPRVLMLAEPTRGMDVGAKDDVVKILRGLKQDGIAVLVVSTEPETVLTLADRILVMRKGRLAREFKGEAVRKEHLLAAA